VPPSPLPGEGISRVSRRRIAARRGIVLALLVISVLLFTSFFREDEGGFLHSVKGTIGAVMTPVQDTAVGAIQPFKDGWNWFAELRTARDERNRLQVENQQLQARVAAQDKNAETAASLRQQLAIANDGPEGYRAVTARVITRPPIDIQRRVTLDKGKDDGIVANSPVSVPVTPDDGGTVFPALVGLVTSVTGNSATVTLITDPSTQVGARLRGTGTALGLLTATSSGTLILDQVPSKFLIQKDMTVVTSGAGTELLSSPYPPDLPIGFVSSVGVREQGEVQSVQVQPFRNPIDLSLFTVWAPDSPQAKRRANG
jgi:rod shape-determining protein MreC